LAEVRFEQDLARALPVEQHPDLADLELRDVAGGWDNQQLRLGAEPAVRLPRTARAPALLRTEQKWLPDPSPKARVGVMDRTRRGTTTRRCGTGPRRPGRVLGSGSAGHR